MSSLFTPSGDSPVVPAMHLHGAVGWNELMASNADDTKRFYTEVVGWKWRAGPMSETMEYHLFGTGEDGGDVGGMCPKTEQMPVSGWLFYFTADDIARTAQEVKTHGGKVLFEPSNVPGVGDMMVCSAPDGSMFASAQWTPPT